MRDVFTRLPAFASDYAGVCGVFYEMNVLTIVCDPGSCFGNAYYQDEPRFTGATNEYTVGIKERMAVFGFDKELEERVLQVLKAHKEQGKESVEGIVFVGTPVSAILGTDLDGLASHISRKTGLPAFGFETTGIRTYEDGECKAFYRLAKKVVGAESDGSVDVNVIGATPLNMWDYNQTCDLIELLKAAGAKNPAVWGRNAGMAEIAQAAGAKLNLVVSSSAVAAAERLKERYGTPYIVGFPIGETSEQAYQDLVRRALSGEAVPEVFEMDSRSRATRGDETRGGEMRGGEARGNEGGKSALIVHEQQTANAIRRMLKAEFGYTDVKVCSYFKPEQAFMESGDELLPDEETFSRLTTDKKYDMIVADPMMRPLACGDQGLWLDFPHHAISSKLYMNDGANCFGARGSRYFGKLLNDRK